MKINIILLMFSLFLICCAHNVRANEEIDLPKPFIVKINKPITVEEARQKIKIPLPNEAAQILFAEYSQFIAHETYLKFEAPLEICQSHAVTLLNEFNTENQPIKLEPITTRLEDISISKELGKLRWFDIQNIKNGFIGVIKGQHGPVVYIDSDRNIFYYLYTD